MTESYISPADIQQFYSSQGRVRDWVTKHADHVFTSPNVPPSELDDQEDALSSPPSDVESSHSIPPRLNLRYPDGRESPIPLSAVPKESGSGRQSRSRSNPQAHSPNQRSRSGSTPSSAELLMLDHRREREKLRSNSPEEIQILPSASDKTPPLPSSGSRHSRSRSLPRDAFSPSQNHDPMPISPVSHHSSHHSSHSHHTTAYMASPPAGPETSPPVIPVLSSPGPHAGLARTQPAPPAWNTYGPAAGVRTGMAPPSREHFKHTPPSIVYAPSHNSRSNYHPPAILSYRPTMGPDRIFYSHSVPPTQAQIARAGYPSVHGSHHPHQEERVHHHKRSSESRHSSSRHRDRSAGSGKSSRSKSTTGRKSGRDRSHSLPLEQEYPQPPEHHSESHGHRSRHHHNRPPSAAGSDNSGSTYYVLPTGRQKIKVLRSPDTANQSPTLYAQSPTSPVSPTKKPKFLQRIFGGFAERFSSSGSSIGSVRRRNSTGTRSNSSQH